MMLFMGAALMLGAAAPQVSPPNDAGMLGPCALLSEQDLRDAFHAPAQQRYMGGDEGRRVCALFTEAEGMRGMVELRPGLAADHKASDETSALRPRFQDVPLAGQTGWFERDTGLYLPLGRLTVLIRVDPGDKNPLALDVDLANRILAREESGLLVPASSIPPGSSCDLFRLADAQALFGSGIAWKGDLMLEDGGGFQCNYAKPDDSLFISARRFNSSVFGSQLDDLRSEAAGGGFYALVKGVGDEAFWMNAAGEHSLIVIKGPDALMISLSDQSGQDRQPQMIAVARLMLKRIAALPASVSSAPQSLPSAAVRACDLFTLDDAKAQFGRDVRTGDKGCGGGSYESCEYVDAKGSTRLYFEVFSEDNITDDLQAKFTDLPKLQSVPDLGDRAYWAPDFGLIVGNGHASFVIFSPLSKGVESKEAAMSIARKMLERIAATPAPTPSPDSAR